MSKIVKKDDSAHSYMWRVFHDNGWQWVQEDSDEEYTTFMLTILVTYDVKIYARVSMHKNHLHLDGHYGVLWLDAEYEYHDRPLSYTELDEMIYAIQKAEENLVMIGIPFTADYKFHADTNRANERLTAKNKTLRNRLNLEQQENEDWE